MFELFKSKVGWLLAGIHLLIVLPCLLYVGLIDEKAVLPVLILMILGAPWWWIILMLLLKIFPSDIPIPNGMRGGFIPVIVAAGILINAFILYLLGLLLTTIFNCVSSRKTNL